MQDFFVRLARVPGGGKGKGSQLYICVVCWAKINKEGEMVAHRYEYMPYITFTDRIFLVDLAVFDWWRYCKALCDVKFRQIEGNSKKKFVTELSNCVISYTVLSNSVCKLYSIPTSPTSLFYSVMLWWFVLCGNSDTLSSAYHRFNAHQGGLKGASQTGSCLPQMETFKL